MAFNLDPDLKYNPVHHKSLKKLTKIIKNYSPDASFKDLHINSNNKIEFTFLSKKPCHVKGSIPIKKTECFIN